MNDLNTKKVGKPKGSKDTTYVKLSDLLSKLNPDSCIPVQTRFLREYDLLNTQSKYVLVKQPNVQIKELDFNQENE